MALSIENLSDWLKSSATENPLHNIVVVCVNLLEAFGRALNQQKLVVENISNQTNAVSELTSVLIKYKSPKTDETPAPLGKTLEETKSILSKLKAQGIEDLPTAEKCFSPGVSSNTIRIWEEKLSANKESLTNQSQQETLKLQTFTNRYGQTSDQAANITQKDYQGKSTFVTNLRGN